MANTYLYGIALSGSRSTLGDLGLPDGRAPVRTLPVGGLTAVFSDYRGPCFTDIPRGELLRLLSIHQRVIEVAMGAGPILPAKFGTILASQLEVRRILDHFQGRLLASLQRMGNSVEIEVAATWDLGATFSEIGREPEIAARLAEAAGQTPERTHALRVQVGELVKQALERRRQAHRRLVLDGLGPLAVDAQPNALLADELVLNIAFLVARHKLDTFYAQVDHVDAVLGGRLSFRCVGPLPPYSFATVDFFHQEQRALDDARQLLRLGEKFSGAEVSASFRRLAASCHPDHNPSDPAAGARFVALAAANAELLSWLRGQNVSGEHTNELVGDLSCSAGTSLPLLQIKRSDPEVLENDCWEPTYECKSVVA